MNFRAPIPITDTDRLAEHGLVVPSSVDGWRWAYRKRNERGTAGAFVRVGNRICVLPDKYVAAIRGDAA